MISGAEKQVVQLKSTSTSSSSKEKVRAVIGLAIIRSVFNNSTGIVSPHWYCAWAWFVTVLKNNKIQMTRRNWVVKYLCMVKLKTVFLIYPVFTCMYYMCNITWLTPYWLLQSKACMTVSGFSKWVNQNHLLDVLAILTPVWKFLQLSRGATGLLFHVIELLGIQLLICHNMKRVKDFYDKHSPTCMCQAKFVI